MSSILIADDSMFQRFMLRKIASSLGHEVIEAADGSQLLEKAQASPPDLILMDLNMPGLSGMEVLEALKERGSALKVVVITADIQHTTRARCMDLGAAEVMNKPLDDAAVAAILARHLA